MRFYRSGNSPSKLEGVPEGRGRVSKLRKCFCLLPTIAKKSLILGIVAESQLFYFCTAKHENNR